MLLNPWSTKLNSAEAREVAGEFEHFLRNITFTFWLSGFNDFMDTEKILTNNFMDVNKDFKESFSELPGLAQIITRTSDYMWLMWFSDRTHVGLDGGELVADG